MALFSAARAVRLCSVRPSLFAVCSAASQSNSAARPLLSQPITVKLYPPRTGDKSEAGMLPSTHWTIERVLALGMLPLYPFALMTSIPAMDWVVATAVTLHGYWGIDGVIKDYVMERRYGKLAQPLCRAIWKVLCAISFAGFCYFNYNDIGFVNAVRKLWTL